MNKIDCMLTVIIPCFNEKDTIELIVDKVLKAPIRNLEIIVVDNDSTDGTREILKEKIENKVSKVLYNEKNIGKGGSVIRGIEAATGDVLIVQDADLEYDPIEGYAKLVAPIIANEADVVYGSRFLDKSNEKGRFLNYLANKLFTFLSNTLTGMHLSDMETCYKAFRRELIQSIELTEQGFGFEPEVTAKIARSGCRVKEVSIKYYPRKTNEGKKVKFSDGLRTLYCIYKFNKKEK